TGETIVIVRVSAIPLRPKADQGRRRLYIRAARAPAAALITVHVNEHVLFRGIKDADHIVPTAARSDVSLDFVNLEESIPDEKVIVASVRDVQAELLVGSGAVAARAFGDDGRAASLWGAVDPGFQREAGVGSLEVDDGAAEMRIPTDIADVAIGRARHGDRIVGVNDRITGVCFQRDVEILAVVTAH